MDQRIASRAYYLFEEILEEMPSFAHLRRARPLAELQLLAGLVWARERGAGPCPVVRTWDKGDESEYEYPSQRGAQGVVRLGRQHRNAAGVLHELAHALGPRDKYYHGRAFRKRCLRLFKVYGDWDGTADWGARDR